MIWIGLLLVELGIYLYRCNGKKIEGGSIFVNSLKPYMSVRAFNTPTIKLNIQEEKVFS